MMGNFGFGGMGFGWIIWLALIVGGYLLLRGRINLNTPDNGGNLSALEILKQRYARGEISKDEFERMKKDLIQ